jgi:AbrB family looped-hinge helix DNA binding protein
MRSVKVNQKGGVIIPADLRKRYGFNPGDRLTFVDYGGSISLVRVLRDPVEEGFGVLKGGSSLTKALERERAKERRSEKKSR